MTEFEHLRIMKAPLSTCDKRAVAAGCYVGEKFVTAVNHCDHGGQICSRINLKSGVQPELCSSSHAEIELLSKVVDMDVDLLPTIVWIYGHYYVCEKCAKALADFGIRELRIRHH